jgi:hypothetical protein
MSFIDMLGPEESAQVAVINYLRLQYPKVLYTHPAQETYTRSKFQKFKNKVLGVSAGVPDLLIFDPKPCEDNTGYYHHGLAIEMKHGRNKCTAEQNKWLKALAERGWKTTVCYGSAEAMDVIDEYLGKK